MVVRLPIVSKSKAPLLYILVVKKEWHITRWRKFLSDLEHFLTVTSSLFSIFFILTF